MLEMLKEMHILVGVHVKWPLKLSDVNGNGRIILLKIFQ
jgi:hypothetical protein